MRRLALVLTVVGLLGLAASKALADRPSSSSSGHVKATMVKHYGHRGAYSSHYRGHDRYRSGYHRGYYPPRYHGHSRYRDHGHSRYGYVFVHPPVVHPPVYSRYRSHYYRPHSGVHYRGRGFGFSITF